MISRALTPLGIGPLDRVVKNGGELVYLVPARVDGEGTFAQIRLPMGVHAEMITAKGRTLAANLGRAVLEVWPTQGNEAGILDLWIANKSRPGAGQWPPLHEGTADVFAGVPIGKTQRGHISYGLFCERNWLVGGRPGQGKTSLVRILVLGAALDPTAELWVFVIAQNTDFAPLAPRLSRYEVGMGPEVAAAAVHALADLLTELERRGTLLATPPDSPPATSRTLANKPALRLHPTDLCHQRMSRAVRHPQQAKHIHPGGSSYRLAPMTRCCPQRATYPPSGCLVSSSTAWERQSSEDTPQRGATPTGYPSSTGTGRGSVSPPCFWTVGTQSNGCSLIGEATSGVPRTGPSRRPRRG